MSINIANKHQLAIEEIALENYDSAIEYFDEILEHYPSHEETLWMRALMPYEKYLNLICREFKVTRELAVNENYEIELDSSIYADRLYKLRKECLYYLMTLFQVADEYVRENTIKKMEKNHMIKLIKDDLDFLQPLNEACEYRSPVVCKLILEYCNKIYLHNLRRRKEIPQDIVYIKSQIEENLRKFNAEVEIALNTDFNEKKKIIEEFLRDENKAPLETASGKTGKIIVFSVITLLIICAIIYFLLLRSDASR